MSESEGNPEARRQQIFERLTKVLSNPELYPDLKAPTQQIMGEMKFVEGYGKNADASKSLDLDSLGLAETYTAIGEEFGIENMDDAVDCVTIDLMADFLVAHATK